MKRLTPTVENPVTEWDDPVPADSEWNWDFPTCSHEVEGQIRSALLSLPDIHFASLVVRRTQDGVCLQGVMQVNETSPDVAEIVQQVAGIENVLNQLLIQTVESPVAI